MAPTGRKFEIETPDGLASAWHFAPASEARSGILMFMDIYGIRPSLLRMAERMASFGHHVVLPDMYYRQAPYAVRPAYVTAASKEFWHEVLAMRKRTPTEMTARDSRYFLNAMNDVGATGKIGTVGYCLGGARALRLAQMFSDRVALAASIHGGHLAVEDEASPHRNLAEIAGRVYIACAGDDPGFSDAQSGLLAEALRRERIDHLIENYADCDHGWSVPDSPTYQAAGAERHWKRLATLFAETLA